MSSPHTALHTHTDKSIHPFSYPVPNPHPHTEAIRPETKAQVKVDKRCLWIFCVTHSNRCLHSPCNYLLTELILAVKWLAKSMCTQIGPESKVVHVVYLLAPSHTWYTAIITEPDRKLLNLIVQESWTTNVMHQKPTYTYIFSFIQLWKITDSWWQICMLQFYNIEPVWLLSFFTVLSLTTSVHPAPQTPEQLAFIKVHSKFKMPAEEILVCWVSRHLMTNWCHWHKGM